MAMTHSSASILSVDDEEDVRAILSKILEAKSYAIDMACDGEEALGLIREHDRYDIAFVDLQMPRMGGLELLRAFQDWRKNTAVVVLTAWGSVGRAKEAMNDEEQGVMNRSCSVRFSESYFSYGQVHGEAASLTNRTLNFYPASMCLH